MRFAVTDASESEAYISQAVTCTAGGTLTDEQEHEDHKINPATGKDNDRDEGGGQILPENDIDDLAN